MYLLIRHRLYRAPRNWRVGAAISINVIVLLKVVTFWAMIIAAHEPPPTFYAPDGTPIDLESVTMPIVPDK
jgi:hypothetical protein